MKKIHIIAIVLIIVAGVVMVNATKDMATYSSFTLAQKQPNEIVKVNGQLVKDKPMTYDPTVDANHFTFYMTDKMDGNESKVIYKSAKPQDFEKSEELVLTGYHDGKQFVATDMLMKCPSKYKNAEMDIKEGVY